MNLKDRLSIRLDNDMRKGLVQFDNWTMSAKVMHQAYSQIKTSI